MSAVIPTPWRIQGAAIYGNIYHQYTPNVGVCIYIYLYHTWILWVHVLDFLRALRLTPGFQPRAMGSGNVGNCKPQWLATRTTWIITKILNKYCQQLGKIAMTCDDYWWLVPNPQQLRFALGPLHKTTINKTSFFQTSNKPRARSLNIVLDLRGESILWWFNNLLWKPWPIDDKHDLPIKNGDLPYDF